MSNRDDASEAQVRAADPAASTWLAANAGSGKTRVLTDRVARLLLDGVEPQNILCLTYTKAAASEMQNRLFRRLGGWAMLNAHDLTKALEELGVTGSVTPDRLRAARRLFARAIETPGGLKIQTIHSFCSALLRRFPLEAGVSPQFSEIEDRAADLLRAEVLDAMASGADSGLLKDLAQHVEGDDLGELTRAIVGHAEGFARDLSQADIRALFGLAADFDPAALPGHVLTPERAGWLPQATAILAGESPTMQKLAADLSALTLITPGPADLDLLQAALLRKADGVAKHGSVPTKKAKEALGGLLIGFQDLMDATEAALQQQKALAAADRTAVLHRFARAFLTRYGAQKAQRGWLDFDDLISRARQLLSDPQVAAWVLYRIDGGIDHILVDEAQDTSPAQWDVIRKLAAEFTSGQGARADRLRTIFVVGDKKQSIYSFQGADPRAFDEMEAEFRHKLETSRQGLIAASLNYSFRSSQAILQLVDETFAASASAGFDPDAAHIPFKADLPGRVDLWPVIPAQETADAGPWYEPLDRQSETHHTTLLATRIAEQIKLLLEPENSVTIPAEDPGKPGYMRRPVRPGDILILFQSRKLSSQNSLFAAVIRALKAFDLPVAGADRLRVGAELAVRDLCALLSFLATPEDDLALASALKSPVFGWSESELYRVSQGRGKKHLWQVLRQKDLPATAVLKDLRAQVDFLRPYDLLERILTRHGGRKRILARLGPEAEDGINALLAQAMAYERTAVPSLTGFLVWAETDDMEIKRQVDTASDQIRVMTVHGAKGLEAPIVILPDCGTQQNRLRGPLLEVAGVPALQVPAAEMPTTMVEAADLARERAAEERQRLLYVALTRAEKWLVVAAAGNVKEDDESWYSTIEQTFAGLPAVNVHEHGLDVRRFEHADWTDLPIVEGAADVPQKHELPDYLSRPAPVVPPTVEVLSPSDLGGAKALPGEEGWDEARAKAYGSEVHRLIEVLGACAAHDRPAMIAGLRPDPEGDFNLAAAEASAILDSPTLAPLFSAAALTEVALTADLGPRRLHGVADKLILHETHIDVVDFKTNRTVPEAPEHCPEGLLRQMGAYVHALAQIYPDRPARAAIVWTRTGDLMPLPHDLVTQALRRTGYLDAGAAAT